MSQHNHYKDQDTLYAFLKNITTIEEYFARKEPCLDDEVSREYAEWSLEHGSEPEHVLSALKANERRRYAELMKQRAMPN
ncbi:hypothetical protein [Aquamicrobium ahrensii]|uniref:Uncharacterized protein n=1 Tax=Aquamicrobium ahrensii TaxID=469551 RepID=A0ABV2KT64_9HYPH